MESIKYIFKDLHKGCDKAFCQIKQMKDQNNDEVIDEIAHYIDGRYVSSMEAAWRLQCFPLYGTSHHVFRLAVHTKDKQNIVFEEEKELESLNNWQTTLTSWFELNKSDEFARTLKYSQIPEYFNYKDRQWHRKKMNFQNCRQNYSGFSKRF